MLFNSFEFIFVFLPVILIIYFYLNRKRLTDASKATLVLGSLFFYGWWNPSYLLLIIVSILFNYIVARVISKLSVASPSKQNRRLSVLILGIVGNLSLLMYFKYSDFFITNVNLIFNSNVKLLNLVLPLAISFFTFQQITYLVDCYKDRSYEYDLLNYAVFVTFFPQLIAGPIVHHKGMMPQFRVIRNKVINYRNISMGLYVFSIGLFKKTVLADQFAIWANAGFDSAATLNLLSAWVASLSYTFQLYFDFSGYSDMAIGLGLLFNIKLPQNFNSPYKSLNIQEFWRRWHMTLSRFLRDYLYIPLGGSHGGKYRVYTNVMITFVLGGLWHGAGWTFIFWGFLHGIALVIHRIWKHFNYKMWNWVAWLITFNLVNIAWVFFRAKDWERALKILTAMFDFNNIMFHISWEIPFFNALGIKYGDVLVDVLGDDLTSIWLGVALILILFFKNAYEKIAFFKVNYATVIFSMIVFIVAIFSANKITQFLYFNF